MMNIEDLAKSFEPWMRIRTWNTPHPSDQKRFHKALSEAISEHGCQDLPDHCKEAMEYLFEKHHSDKMMDRFSDDIDQYVHQVDIISSYIYDITEI